MELRTRPTQADVDKIIEVFDAHVDAAHAGVAENVPWKAAIEHKGDGEVAFSVYHSGRLYGSEDIWGLSGIAWTTPAKAARWAARRANAWLAGKTGWASDLWG